VKVICDRLNVECDKKNESLRQVHKEYEEKLIRKADIREVERMTLEALGTEKAFRDWQQYIGTSFLFLRGRNHPMARSQSCGLCWLSLGAAEFCEALQTDGSLYVFCSLTWDSTEGRQVNGKSLLEDEDVLERMWSSIIPQILTWDTEVFGTEIIRLLNSLAQGQVKSRADIVARLLKIWGETHTGQTVHVVVAGIDNCGNKTKAAVKELLQTLAEPKTVLVKAMVVGIVDRWPELDPRELAFATRVNEERLFVREAPWVQGLA
jgi:hypothetical protein